MKTKGSDHLTLRPMAEADLDHILEIEQLCFSSPWIRENFLLDLRTGNSCCLVAREGQRLNGYIISWLVMNELHILNIAVHPDHRRRGIGRALLVELLATATAKGCRWATLELRISNEAARGLYENFGFRPVAIRKGYYRHPTEDAVLMLMDLDSELTGGSPNLEVPDGVVSQG